MNYPIWVGATATVFLASAQKFQRVETVPSSCFGRSQRTTVPNLTCDHLSDVARNTDSTSFSLLWTLSASVADVTGRFTAICRRRARSLYSHLSPCAQSKLKIALKQVVVSQQKLLSATNLLCRTQSSSLQLYISASRRRLARLSSPFWRLWASW
jgi:hypothetical protein